MSSANAPGKGTGAPGCQLWVCCHPAESPHVAYRAQTIHALIRRVCSQCNDWTCSETDVDCKSCSFCTKPEPPPPAPLPLPPGPPSPPTVPLQSTGLRPADYWTSGHDIMTNAFGGEEPRRVVIKGISWSGLESNPCYLHVKASCFKPSVRRCVHALDNRASRPTGSRQDLS